MDALLAQYDLVVSPTVAIAPFETGADVPANHGYTSWIEWASFTFPINLSQQPACSVPCGRTSKGLPVGLQFIGARGADEKVLIAALSYEDMFTERFLSRGAAWPLRPQVSA
jgi:amidase/aspartyl-tRNA(Asn)/glutamyl-tRNA(Gln) amidotransferase subunit A